MKALADPSATPEQRAQLAQSTIDNANWMSRQLDEMNTFGARREVDAIQRELENVVGEMRPYATMLGELGAFKMPDEIIGRSVGAKSKNYDILDLSTGSVYHLVEGTRLQNIEVFAGKGTKVEFRDAPKYADRYGGEVDAWQHAKGVGIVNTPGGDTRAELHWIQCDGIGKKEMFVKEWLE